MNIWIPDSARGPDLTRPDPWMAENQLEAILKEIPEDGGFFLEYGSGGSTLWFHDRLPATVTHVAFECNREWAIRVSHHGGPVIHATKMSYERASNIEASCFETDYICRPEVAAADVVLVDGFNRSVCLAWCSHVCQPGTRIFLHDYDWNEFKAILQLPCWKDQTVIEPDGTNDNPGRLMRMVLK